MKAPLLPVIALLSPRMSRRGAFGLGGMSLAQDIAGNNEGSSGYPMHFSWVSGVKRFPKLHFQPKWVILRLFGAEVEL